MYNKNRKGFTLVEIMIVVAIIALLATIAIPGIIRARVTANESSAIASTKTMATGSETFRAANSAGLYPAVVTDLTGATPPYVTGFTNANPAVKAGYNYTLLGDANSFNAAANSDGANSGTRNFCIDQTGVLRSNPLATVYAVSATADCGGTAVSQ